jgi:hypothetical protein
LFNGVLCTRTLHHSLALSRAALSQSDCRAHHQTDWRHAPYAPSQVLTTRREWSGTACGARTAGATVCHGPRLIGSLGSSGRMRSHSSSVRSVGYRWSCGRCRPSGLGSHGSHSKLESSRTEPSQPFSNGLLDERPSISIKTLENSSSRHFVMARYINVSFAAKGVGAIFLRLPLKRGPGTFRRGSRLSAVHSRRVVNANLANGWLWFHRIERGSPLDS